MLRGPNGTRGTGVESTFCEVRARLVSAKLEEDNDIHLVIKGVTTSGTMNGAAGGTPVPLAHDRMGQDVCAAYGGTFLPQAVGALVWQCDWHVTDYASQFAALDAACRYDLGSNFAETYTHPESLTADHALTDCYRL